MNNKKIYDEKVIPVKNKLIDYYGYNYRDKINQNFNTLIYNFDDIFTSSYNTFNNSPNIYIGLIDNYKNIKAKELFNKLYQKHLDIVLKRILEETGIDLHDNYNIFINQFFSLSKFETIINDPVKMQTFANMNNIDINYVDTIITFFFQEKLNFYNDLLKIHYFKDLYKRVGKDYDIFLLLAEQVLDRFPIVSRFNYSDDKVQGNYLYFPYLNSLDDNNNLDTMLIHELIHVAECEPNSNVIGLNNGHNSFINEVRTDLIAINQTKLLTSPLLEKRDIGYKSLYLKIANPFLDFFNKYERILSDIAITKDFDKLTYYFSQSWNEFDKRMEELFIKTYQELVLRQDKNQKVTVKYDLSIISNLINDMETVANNKILLK